MRGKKVPVKNLKKKLSKEENQVPVKNPTVQAEEHQVSVENLQLFRSDDIQNQVPTKKLKLSESDAEDYGQVQLSESDAEDSESDAEKKIITVESESFEGILQLAIDQDIYKLFKYLEKFSKILWDEPITFFQNFFLRKHCMIFKVCEKYSAFADYLLLDDEAFQKLLPKYETNLEGIILGENFEEEKIISRNNSIRSQIKMGELLVDDDMKIVASNCIFNLDNLDAMENLLVDSPYGLKNEKLIDKTVRSAKETKDFKLTFMDKIYDIFPKYSIQLYKLNVYKEGDFFKSHLDTERKGLLKTLVLFLPSPFEGGDLHFNELNYNYKPLYEPNKCFWIIFPFDTPHEVQKVHAGKRATITFNCYVKKKAQYMSPPLLESITPFPMDMISKLNQYNNIVCGAHNPYIDYYKKVFKDWIIVYSLYNKITINNRLFLELGKDLDCYEQIVLKGGYLKAHYILNNNGQKKSDILQEYYGNRGNSPAIDINVSYSEYCMFNPDMSGKISDSKVIFVIYWR